MFVAWFDNIAKPFSRCRCHPLPSDADPCFNAHGLLACTRFRLQPQNLKTYIQKSVPDNIVTFLCFSDVTHKRSMFCCNNERASTVGPCSKTACGEASSKDKVCPPLCPGVGRQFTWRLLCSACLAQHPDCLPCPCPTLTGFSRASVPHAGIVSNLFCS